MTRIKNKLNDLLNSELENCLYWLSILLILIIVPVYGISYWIAEYYNLGFLSNCSMKSIFGIPCPGCGGTRAICYFFTGQFLSALYYHAFAVYSVVLYLIFFITQTLQRLTKGKISGAKFRDIYWQVGLVILIVQYIAKLLIPGYQI